MSPSESELLAQKAEGTFSNPFSTENSFVLYVCVVLIITFYDILFMTASHNCSSFVSK